MVGTFPRLVPDCGMVSHWGRNLSLCDETVLSPRRDGYCPLVRISPLGGGKNLRRWQRHTLRMGDVLPRLWIFPGPVENVGPVTTCGVATMSSI